MRGIADDPLAAILVRARQLEPSLRVALHKHPIPSRACYSVAVTVPGLPEIETPPTRRVHALAFLDGLVTGAECVKFERERDEA